MYSACWSIPLVHLPQEVLETVPIVSHRRISRDKIRQSCMNMWLHTSWYANANPACSCQPSSRQLSWSSSDPRMTYMYVLRMTRTSQRRKGKKGGKRRCKGRVRIAFVPVDGVIVLLARLLFFFLQRFQRPGQIKINKNEITTRTTETRFSHVWRDKFHFQIRERRKTKIPLFYLDTYAALRR